MLPDPPQSVIVDVNRLPSMSKRHRVIGWVIFSVLGLLLLSTIPQLFDVEWVGNADQMLSFRVEDADSQKPLAGASIFILGRPRLLALNVQLEPDAPGAASRNTSTDEDGHAELICQFRAGGRKGYFVDQGVVVFSDRCVRVTADGYEPAAFFLEERLGGGRDIHDKSPMYLEVKLKRTLEAKP